MINGDFKKFQNIVEINAGAALYVAGKVKEIKEGAKIVKKTINSGQTKKYITNLING